MRRWGFYTSVYTSSKRKKDFSRWLFSTFFAFAKPKPFLLARQLACFTLAHAKDLLQVRLIKLQS